MGVITTYLGMVMYYADLSARVALLCEFANENSPS